MTTFGLQLPNFTFPGPFMEGPRVADDDMFEHVAGLAVAAEESGFESVMVMDHFWQLPPLGGPDQPILEGYTLLAALAARTEKVKLGTLVTGVTYRNPALLAKMVTTLDVISRGRAFLGIGAAWYEEEHVALGFDFPSVRERMQRLEEAVQICRAMFTEEAPSFTGTHYRIEGAKNLPRPIQPGGPPIMVGGSGEQRTLRIVARYADMCNVHGSPATIRHKLDVLRKHCDDLGRDPSEITTTRRGSLMLAANEDESEATAKIIRDIAGAEFDEQFTIGTEDQIVEQVGALVDAGLDCLIFDMAYGTADQVRQVGKRLVSEFGYGRTVTTLAERLGHAPDAKLLIINCDDLGSTRSANLGVYEALRNGVATSASLMVPCPWARDAAALYRGEDVGVHLTLNSEWETYRWGPITHSPSLLDGDGGFPRTVEDSWDHGDIEEVRKECRAQVERAILWGFDVSHVDSHMGTLQLRADFFDVYLELAVDFGLPLRMAGASAERVVGFPFRKLAADEGVVFTDHFVLCPISARKRIERVLFDLRPGVTEVYLHPALDTDELRAACDSWAGRVEDHAFLCHDRSLPEMIDRAGATLIGYRELRELQRA